MTTYSNLLNSVDFGGYRKCPCWLPRCAPRWLPLACL